MKFVVRLFDTTTEAADGSTIRRPVCEEYLASDDYKIIIADKVAIGGETHKDRKIQPEYQGLIGMDDQVLVSDNATHYITKLWFESPTDPVLYCEAETFDPELFAGKRRDHIINVIGMIKSGVKMPISVVIQALWDSNNNCRKIIRIKGFDFTQNNSFPKAGLVKVMSNTEYNSKDETLVKTFSSIKEDLTGCRLMTKVFSGEVEIIDAEAPLEKDERLFSRLLNSNRVEFSYSDIISSYGLYSLESKIANQYKGRKLSKDTLNKLADDYDKISARDRIVNTMVNVAKDSTTQELNDIIDKLVSDDQRDALHLLLQPQKLQLIRTLTQIPKSDPNYESLLKIELDKYFRTIPTTATFSTINSVKDRVLLINYPRFSTIDRVIKTYSNYYLQKKDSLSDIELEFLIQLFIQDLDLLIKRVLDYIYKGTSLTTLYALNRYGDEVSESAKDLSYFYRKIIITEKNLGFIPVVTYDNWITKLKYFYLAMIHYTFNIEYDLKLTLLDRT